MTTLRKGAASPRWRTGSGQRLYGWRGDPASAPLPTPAKAVDTSASLLFAYKLNWQSVFFVGYGDERLWAESSGDLEPVSRSIFVKASYAFQR